MRAITCLLLASQKGPSIFVPDLIVEVVSPGDSRPEVEQKAQEWLDAGDLLSGFAVRVGEPFR